MTNDQKEALELAKTHKAIIEPIENALTIAFYEKEFLAFVAALEEKHRAKIAMLNYVLQEVKLDYEFMGVFSQEVLDAISATQQDTDAFIAEKQAEVLEEVIEDIEYHLSFVHSANAGEYASAHDRGMKNARDMVQLKATELRTSAAQPKGKEVK